MLHKLGISTLWMCVLAGMHPDYCFMRPPDSCSLLGSSVRLPGPCSRQPMPNSVCTSHILSHGRRMLTRVSPLVMTVATSAPREPSGGHAAPAAAVSPGQGDAAAALRGLHLGQERVCSSRGHIFYQRLPGGARHDGDQRVISADDYIPSPPVTEDGALAEVPNMEST